MGTLTTRSLSKRLLLGDAVHKIEQTLANWSIGRELEKLAI